MASKGSKFAVEILTAVEVTGLVRACSGRSHGGIRDAAPVGIIYRAGLRVAQAQGTPVSSSARCNPLVTSTTPLPCTPH